MNYIVFVALIVNGLLVVWDKYYFTNKISNFAQKRGYKLLFDMMDCRFCISFHLSFLVCFSWDLVLFLTQNRMPTFDTLILSPFASASLLQIINSFKKNGN
jgi:hypothetical protein